MCHNWTLSSCWTHQTSPLGDQVRATRSDHTLATKTPPLLVYIATPTLHILTLSDTQPAYFDIILTYI